METLHILAMWMPSGLEWLVILVIALLLFGKRLPEVARSMGKGIVEFKKGVKGIEDEVDDADRQIDDETKKKEHEAAESGKGVEHS